MNCPRCNAPAADETLREFGGVCPKCLLAFTDEKDAPAFPNLEIVELIGQGGMGVVYKALQKNLNRTVALKVLSPHLSEDPEFVERFTREARALAQLSHPNIVGIHDSGIYDRVPYLVMEYVDGAPLRSLLASGKITSVKVLELIPQICDALQYAHAHGVIHRDIKPENILIDPDGRVKIADFGLAKLASVEETRITRTGMVMGSPHYMAPEQMENSGKVDHRADIYSLGVVFYEMLTGELPLGRFKAPSDRSKSDKRLDPVVLKSLEREPDDRWQSADEVKDHVTNLERRKIILPGQKTALSGTQPTSRTLWIACGILAVMAAFSLEGGHRSSAIWTAFGAGICGVFALSRARKTPPPDKSSRPALKVVVHDPYKRAALILSILGGVPTVLGVVFTHLGYTKLAILPITLGVFLLLVAAAVAMVALIRHALNRASGGSTGWAVALIVIAMLVLAGLLSSETKSASWPPSSSSQDATAFRLAGAWPSSDELPPGLPYENLREGAAVFAPRKPGEPDPPGTATNEVGKPWKDMLPDLALVRSAEFRKGQLILVGFEFKTDFARRRWEKECSLWALPFEDGKAPAGRSLFHLGGAGGAEYAAAMELLTPLLRKKMREAAGR